MDDQPRAYGALFVGLALTGAILFGRPGTTPTPPPQAARESSLSEPLRAAPSDPVAPISVADADVMALLGSFLNVDVDTMGADAAFEAVVDRAQMLDIDVEFVVASIPDWVDSNARWLSDGMLDALQRAMVQSGYVLDRFRFPDLEAGVVASGSRPVEEKRRHEEAPGVVLFRNADWRPAEQAPPDVFVLFLVAETATSGIHARPFLAASRFALRWHRELQGGSPRLRILGPTFSGSSPSLRMAIDELLGDRRLATGVCVNIVSGSATWEGNKELFERGNVPVTFHATVLPDSFARARLLEYVRGLLPHGDEAKIAILVESNTSYGLGLQPADVPAEPPHRAHVATPILTLPFPLHISRLRSNGSETRQDRLPESTRRVALALDDTGYANDRVPTLSPGTTLPHVELVLQNLLDTIRREEVVAVGLFATDTRDKLFLAREVARRSPNVLLFTLESDLLYTHAEYGPYMRGTIVGSTYPLFNSAQVWTNPEVAARGRQQFTSTNVHGAYNALLALVNYDATGRAGTGASPVLLDYRSPSELECVACRPPFWISVAARDGLWPVAIYPFSAATSAEDRYVFTWRPQGTAAPPHLAHGGAVVHPSTTAVSVFALLSLVVLVHVVAYWASALRSWPPFCWFSAEVAASTDPDHGQCEHQRYLLACFVALLAISVPLNTLFLIWLYYEGNLSWAPSQNVLEFGLQVARLGVVTIVSWAGLGGCVVIVGQLLARFVSRPGSRRAWWAIGLGAVFLGPAQE